MALNEHCSNAWHMLIERLILLYKYNKYKIKKKYNFIIIKSGEQVSIRVFNRLGVG